MNLLCAGLASLAKCPGCCRAASPIRPRLAEEVSGSDGDGIVPRYEVVRIPSSCNTAVPGFRVSVCFFCSRLRLFVSCTVLCSLYPTICSLQCQ